MGLGGMKSAWQRQTKDFAHTKADDYSSLVIDNRGVGDSDKPACRYSTSDMAKDVIEVIDHVGWTAKRELHIIGISMGGMIAQELVSLNHSAGLIHCTICSVLPPAHAGCTPIRQSIQKYPTRRRFVHQKNAALLIPSIILQSYPPPR